MTHRKITAQMLGNEVVLTTSRSGGPGGQNVNKVSSKVTLQFDVRNSAVLTPSEKDAINEKLASRMTRDGVLVLSVQESRSQLMNRELAFQKLEKLLAKAFIRRKPRKPTKPSRTAVQDRLKKKKTRSEKKRWRQRPTDE